MLVKDLIAELNECHPLAEVGIAGGDFRVISWGPTALTVDLDGYEVLSEEEMESRISEAYREAEEEGEEALREAEREHEESVEGHRMEAYEEGYSEGVHAAHRAHGIKCHEEHDGS